MVLLRSVDVIHNVDNRSQIETISSSLSFLAVDSDWIGTVVKGFISRIEPSDRIEEMRQKGGIKCIFYSFYGKLTFSYTNSTAILPLPLYHK